MRIELERILLPTDFSESSETATLYAAALAERFHSEIVLLHIVEEVNLFMPVEMMVPPPPAASMVEQLREIAQRALDKVIAEHHFDRITHQGLVRVGTPFVEIITCAKEMDVDLIVMGTHGRTGLRHTLVGSVAEKVVRKAPCPVLTVRHPEHEFVHP